MNILESDKSLRKNPFRTPEGYISSLPDRLSAIGKCPKEEHEIRHNRTAWQIIAPYAAMAAMFAIITIAGKAIINIAEKGNEWTEDKQFYYTELIPVTGTSETLFGEFSSEFIASTSTNDYDIIQYLINDGITVEEINNHEYE